MRADGTAGCGQNLIQTDRAHERRLAGHVGAGDQCQRMIEGEIVADCLIGIQQRVSQLRKCQNRRRFLMQLRHAGLRMRQRDQRQRFQRFQLSQQFHHGDPRLPGLSLPLIPGPHALQIPKQQ